MSYVVPRLTRLSTREEAIVFVMALGVDMLRAECIGEDVGVD